MFNFIYVICFAYTLYILVSIYTVYLYSYAFVSKYAYLQEEKIFLCILLKLNLLQNAMSSDAKCSRRNDTQKFSCIISRLYG